MADPQDVGWLAGLMAFFRSGFGPSDSAVSAAPPPSQEETVRFLDSHGTGFDLEAGDEADDRIIDALDDFADRR